MYRPAVLLGTLLTPLLLLEYNVLSRSIFILNMALLGNTPDELCVQILSYLSRQHLARVSRVCRRMNRITTPLLYDEIWLGNCNESSIDLGLFIRTLHTPGSEGLATLVHTLHLAWSCEVMPLYHEDLALFLDSAAKFWGYDGRQLTESGQVILLLHLLPNLHTLDVFPPDESDEYSDFIDSLCSPMRPRTALPMTLRSLRIYTCSWHIFGCSAFGLTLLTILRLPHIESITIPAPEGIYFTDQNALTAAATSSTVTHLKFPSARISQRELLTILKTPRALTHFSFFAHAIKINYNSHALRTALDPLRNTLTNLVLHFWTSQPLSTHRGDPSTTIGSLRDWPVLRSLHCSLLLILGLGLPGESRDIARVLPECVRELEILDDRFWTPDDALQEAVLMVRQKRAMVPELRRLTVYSRRGGCPEARERLRSACLDAGVVCVDYVVRRVDG